MSHRKLIDRTPFAPPAASDTPPWNDRQGWPYRWVAPSIKIAPPMVLVYRCVVDLPVEQVVTLHVTADERYSLHLDGQLLGRGPERGDPDHWFFETYDLPLSAGRHTLTAKVWSLGVLAPWAQRTVTHGLLVAPQDDALRALIGTGFAPWEWKACEGLTFADASADVGTAVGAGPGESVDGNLYDPAIERGVGDGWQSVIAGEHGNDGFILSPFRPHHRLHPATLPSMRERPIHGVRVRSVEGGTVEPWQSALEGVAPSSVPANTSVRILLELDVYRCFYARLRLNGGAGALVCMTYAESSNAQQSGMELLRGVTDRYLPNGSAKQMFVPLWWRCGRFIELSITTVELPLTIDGFDLFETGYPLDLLELPQSDSSDLNGLLVLCRRTVEACCHETFMDCPYYEQLMYVGDTRLQCLILYTQCRDPRPAIKALRMIEASSINFNRLPTDAAPGDAKFIPPFATIWIGMVHDFARYHDRSDVLRELMPTVRSVLDRLLAGIDGSLGLLRSPAGWNFIDWAGDPFHYGVPPGGERGGVCASINLLLLQALQHAAEIETHLGEPELAARWGRLASELKSAIRGTLFDQSRSLFRESLDSEVFTEHANCLALLSGAAAGVEADVVASLAGRRAGPPMVRCSPYFCHYLFEAFYAEGESAAFYARLSDWYALRPQGLSTTPETFGATRSQCHAWTAHPLYHAVASIAGVRPIGLGGGRVVVRPMLRDLTSIDLTTPVAGGTIRLRLRRSSDRVDVETEMTTVTQSEIHINREILTAAEGVSVFHSVIPNRVMSQEGQATQTI